MRLHPGLPACPSRPHAIHWLLAGPTGTLTRGHRASWSTSVYPTDWLATGWRELRLIFSITVALTLGEMAWVSVWLCLPPALQKHLCSLWLSCGSAICPGFAKPLTRCDIGDMPVVNRCQRPVLPRSPTRCLPRAWWRRWAPAAMWMAWVAETWLRAGAAGLDLGRAALQCGCPGTCGWLLVWLKQSFYYNLRAE